jgi:hypothetical protein
MAGLMHLMVHNYNEILQSKKGESLAIRYEKLLAVSKHFDVIEASRRT